MKHFTFKPMMLVTMLVALFAAIPQTGNAQQNSIPCTADEFNFSYYTSIDGKTEGGYNGLGSFRNGYKVTYLLNNTSQQAYTIKFAYKGGHSATTINFTFTDQDFNEVKASKTVQVVSDWAYTELDIPELPEGDITMQMEFTIPSGTWCCNMKEMSFSAQSSEKYVELPTPTFDLLRYTENQTAQAEEQRTSTTLESFKNGSYVTYLLNNTVANKYLIAFEAGTPRDDAAVNITITDKETGSVELYNEDITIANTGSWNTWKTYIATLPEMAVGKYTLKLTFKSSATNWTANMQNLRFADAATVNNVADESTINFAKPWATSGTIKCAAIIDSDRNGAKAVYLAKTEAAADYNLVVKAATPNDGVQLKVSALKLDGDTIATNTLNVVKGADWNTTQDLTYELGQVPEGLFYVVFDIIKNDNSWAVNIHEAAFAKNTATAISDERFNMSTSGKMFNLRGQRVNSGYKGIIISNGKKVVLK